MGSSTSKLAVQERFNALSLEPDVGKDDEIWGSILTAPSSTIELSDGEFYGLVTVDEIRRIRMNQPDNFKLLLFKTTERLEGLTRMRMIGTNGTVAPQISNCCRILTRVAPVVYESEGRSEFKELLCKCIHTLTALMHFRGFTTPLDPRPSVVWTEGIGCPVVDRDSGKYSRQRVEVLRALLSILSSPLYSNSTDELEYFTTMSRDPAILCSLLNTSLLKTNCEVGSLSLCLLVISLTHMARSKNQFRKYIAKIHKQEDLDWLSASIKQHYDTTNDKTMSVSLLWELVQANSEFASKGGSLVSIADTLIEEVGQTIDVQSEVQSARLWLFTLLSMTAQNHWCAQAIAPKVMSIVVAHKKDLSSPSIELATLVDVFWNCAPSLVLTDNESAELKELREGVHATNSTVHMVIESILEVMKPMNPSLDTGESIPCSKWNPIQFRWDSTRFRWYQGIQWGHTYQAEPRIWCRTQVKLFKVTKPQPKSIPPVNLVNTATSFIRG